MARSFAICRWNRSKSMSSLENTTEAPVGPGVFRASRTPPVVAPTPGGSTRARVSWISTSSGGTARYRRPSRPRRFSECQSSFCYVEPQRTPSRLLFHPQNLKTENSERAILSLPPVSSNTPFRWTQTILQPITCWVRPINSLNATRKQITSSL